MIKLASNAFLATKISFINEIANVCEEVGADVGEVAAGMGLDPRIGGSFLNAGIGFGGSCFPKDVSALKQLAGNSGYHFQLLTAVIEVNELQKRRVVSKLKKHLGSLVGKKVALLGLAFKPHTDDMREASSVVLASRLQGEGAIVRAYDPVAEERAGEMLTGVGMCDSALDAVEGADAAVIVTEWPEFADLDLSEIRRPHGKPRDRGRPEHAGPDGPCARPASCTRASAASEPQLTAGTPTLGRYAGADTGRRRRHAAAAAHDDGAQTGRAARQPPVHHVHDRLAGPPWLRRHRDVVRVPGRGGARGARYGQPERRHRPVRGRAGAARHGRSGEARRAGPRRAVRGPERRRPHRPRHFEAAYASTSSMARPRRSACIRSRTPPHTGSS